MRELIVFAHGMANFAHKRGTKEDQERLIRTQPSARHKFLGAFDDSGNFAFVTLGDSGDLQAKVLAALKRQYEVKGVVVIERARADQALAALERIARVRYGDNFQGWSPPVVRPERSAVCCRSSPKNPARRGMG